MYTPEDAISLDKINNQQIRLGIQGFPGTGKTWAALTFPNPIVMDFDAGLGAHTGRKDVLKLSFNDNEWCKKINPNHKDRSSLRTTVMLWLDKVGSKLESDQTLIVDGLTSLENIYHKWYEQNRVFSKSTGKEVEYAEWTEKITFFTDFGEKLKTLKCNVVFITHESEKKEKSGEYTGKIRPLITGQTVDKIVGFFTDWARQWSTKKPDYSKLDSVALSKWGMTLDEFKKMCDTFPRDTIHYWQFSGDEIFDAKASSLVNFPSLMPANYESFKKYMK